MCAITGFLDYGHRVHHRVLLHLVKALTVAAECRGTDATGMSYVKNGEMTPEVAQGNYIVEKGTATAISQLNAEAESGIIFNLTNFGAALKALSRLFPPSMF